MWLLIGIKFQLTVNGLIDRLVADFTMFQNLQADRIGAYSRFRLSVYTVMVSVVAFVVTVD